MRKSRRLGLKRAGCALTQARLTARSLRALSASLLTSTSILVAPVAISAPLTVATLAASAWLGATPAAAQAFPTGGYGGSGGDGTYGGAGGYGPGAGGCGCVAEPGDSTSYAGGGGGGGGPNSAGASGGSGAGGSPGAGGPIGAAGGNATGAGSGGGGGGGGTTGATTFSSSPITGGAGGVGGNGASGAYGGGGGGGGGAGGYGVRFTGSGTIVTGGSFSATGGVGGNGGNGGDASVGDGGVGGHGGDGGAGVFLGAAVASFTNNGAITGGNGGDAGASGTGPGGPAFPSFGGSGGIGLLLNGATTVINNQTIIGGDGRGGLEGGSGIGGYGSGATVINNSTITGGAGSGVAVGGYGIFLRDSTVTNSGTITGGSAYHGGTGVFLLGGTITNNANGVIRGGAGSTVGGMGITAIGATIINRGTIQGGGAAFGYAIFGSNLTVINSNIIDGNGGVAIGFTGGTNVLELQAGSLITGAVYGGCGCNSNTLRFGGVGFGGIGSPLPTLASATPFDLSLIGVQYQGFSAFQVTGGVWEFTSIAGQGDPWTITNGVAFLSGDLSAASNVTVNSNGALIGNGGVLNNLQINSGGIFAPGVATAINGNLGFTSAANYVIAVDPATASRADVSGTATLGGTVRASFANGAYGNTGYLILTANTITGTFNNGVVVDNNPDGLFPSLIYLPTAVFLGLTTAVPTVPGLSGNAQNVANAITAFSNNGGTVPGGIAGLFGLAGSAANNAFGQLAGQPGAASAQSGIGSTNTFINTIFDTAFGAGSGIGGGSLGYADEAKVSPAVAEAYAAVTPRDRRVVPFTARWNVWATGYGGYSQTDGSASAGTATTTSRVWGLVAAAEYRFSLETKAGFAMGGSGSSFDLSGGFGNGSADAFNLAIYGKHQMGAAYIAGALGYSVQAAKTKRVIGADVLEADFTGQVLSARLEAGYRYAMRPIAIAPYAALQSTTFFLPSYSEHATSGLNTFALSYDSEAITATRSELGARFDKVFGTGEGIWTLRSKLAWAHDWNTDQHATASFQALPGASFTVNGAEPSADSALVSLGAEYAWGNGWSLAANFDGEFSSTTSSYAGKGTLRYEW